MHLRFLCLLPWCAESVVALQTRKDNLETCVVRTIRLNISLDTVVWLVVWADESCGRLVDVEDDGEAARDDEEEDKKD